MTHQEGDFEVVGGNLTEVKVRALFTMVMKKANYMLGESRIENENKTSRIIMPFH